MPPNPGRVTIDQLRGETSAEAAPGAAMFVASLIAKLATLVNDEYGPRAVYENRRIDDYARLKLLSNKTPAAVVLWA